MKGKLRLGAEPEVMVELVQNQDRSLLSWLPVSSLRLPAGARGSVRSFGFPRRRCRDKSLSASLYLGGAAPTGEQWENEAGREVREGEIGRASCRERVLFLV